MKDISNQIPGAIHRFLYDLKCTIERRQREEYSRIDIDQRKNENKIVSPAPSPSRRRKTKFEEMQLKHVENKLHIS